MGRINHSFNYSEPKSIPGAKQGTPSIPRGSSRSSDPSHSLPSDPWGMNQPTSTPSSSGSSSDPSHFLPSDPWGMDYPSSTPPDTSTGGRRPSLPTPPRSSTWGSLPSLPTPSGSNPWGPLHPPQPWPNPSHPPGGPGIEALTPVTRSKWNGFKRMSPEVQDAIRQFNAACPENIASNHSTPPREHSIVFLDQDGKTLAKGLTVIGNEAGVSVSPEIENPKAKVVVHSHPFTGKHSHYEPSPADQSVARRYQQLEHIIQTPAPRADIPNQYLIYSGTVPPRHYILVENPDNLPVSPRSEDGVMPPFRPKPPSA